MRLLAGLDHWTALWEAFEFEAELSDTNHSGDLNTFKGRWNRAAILNNTDTENRRNTVWQQCS